MDMDKNPIDQMIQGNKDEADSTLALWGMKPRKGKGKRKAKR